MTTTPHPIPSAPGADGSPPRGGHSSVVGTWAVLPGFRSAADIVPLLTFAADGTLCGFDGCNGFSGRWTASGRGAELEIERNEMKDCVRGTTALQYVTIVTVDEDGARMDAFTKPGSRLMSLEPGDGGSGLDSRSGEAD